MKYKGSGKYPLYLLFFVIFVILFVAQTYDPEKKELGSYSINNVNSSKIYLNILNISKLELTIENIFINDENNICNTGDVYVYGTLRTSSEFVRIRINDIKVNNNLKIGTIDAEQWDEPTLKGTHESFKSNTEINYVNLSNSKNENVFNVIPKVGSHDMTQVFLTS